MSHSEDFKTPMMMQYLNLKKENPDSLLFFRLGDFYELFLEDAKIGSEVLGITLTARSRGKDGKVPMAGVPYHALDNYLGKLVSAGHKVAICEQTSDFDEEQKIVRREVVRIVTPGTLMDESSLDKTSNNYILSLDKNAKSFGIALADVSTGQFFFWEDSIDALDYFLQNSLLRFNPSECILSESLYNDPSILSALKFHKNMNIYSHKLIKDLSNSSKVLCAHFNIQDLGSLGLRDFNLATVASASLLDYLKDTQKSDLTHITKALSLGGNTEMNLDRSTIVNLELLSTIRDNSRFGSLLHVIDRTKTALGSRLLKHWLLHPLVVKTEIEDRHEAVLEMMNITTVEGVLSKISDIERLLSRLSVGIGSPRDLLGLADSFYQGFLLKDSLSQMKSPLLNDLIRSFDKRLSSLSDSLAKKLSEHPPIDPKSGGIFKDGIDSKLDKYKATVKGSKDFIASLEKSERERSGISSLKIKFNKIFGYYIDITNSNLKNVPEDYERKQTLVNSERFITSKLKRHEQIILSNEEKIFEIEYQMFLELVSEVLEHTSEIQLFAKSIASIDCLNGFATVAKENRYVKPVLTEDGAINITKGRHPVLEKILDIGDFVPNDLLLDDENQHLLLLTGPNMSGKSVYIRQVALIVLLAQIGSFVPAKHAHISVMDHIFVRSGASDMISMGLSTFMVEMVETSYILNNVTPNSLVVMDEIGRGTSTYDGISIAWSIAEYLVTNFKKGRSPKVLFATHYHELQKLENDFTNKVKNYQVAVDRLGDKPVFLHEVVEGASDHSFGIDVAKLAGLPEGIIKNAQKMLRTLES